MSIRETRFFFSTVCAARPFGPIQSIPWDMVGIGLRMVGDGCMMVEDGWGMVKDGREMVEGCGIVRSRE